MSHLLALSIFVCTLALHRVRGEDGTELVHPSQSSVSCDSSSLQAEGSIKVTMPELHDVLHVPSGIGEIFKLNGGLEELLHSRGRVGRGGKMQGNWNGIGTSSDFSDFIGGSRHIGEGLANMALRRVEDVIEGLQASNKGFMDEKKVQEGAGGAETDLFKSDAINEGHFHQAISVPYLNLIGNRHNKPHPQNEEKKEGGEMPKKEEDCNEQKHRIIILTEVKATDDSDEDSDEIP